MRKVPFFLLTVLLFSIISPDTGLCQAPVKVGALVPFTGRWGDSGRECAKGMLDAAKWLNQGGGIFGRKLEVRPSLPSPFPSPRWGEGGGEGAKLFGIIL